MAIFSVPDRVELDTRFWPGIVCYLFGDWGMWHTRIGTLSLLLAATAVIGACDTGELSPARAPPVHPGTAETIVLDAQRCANAGDTNLYVVIGETVMRVPGENGPVSRYPVRADVDKLPAPPSPAAPEGCLEHAARAQVLHLTRYQEPLFSTRPEFNGALVSVDVNWWPEQRSRLQDSNQRLSDRMLRDGHCRPMANGLSGCGRGDLVSARVTTYRAGSPMHASPDGQPFVVVCGLGPSVWADDCEVSYLILGHVGLNYRFDRKRVGVERMVDLDRALRSGVMAMVVEGYSWPMP